MSKKHTTKIITTRNLYRLCYQAARAIDCVHHDDKYIYARAKANLEAIRKSHFEIWQAACQSADLRSCNFNYEPLFPRFYNSMKQEQSPEDIWG